MDKRIKLSFILQLSFMNSHVDFDGEECRERRKE